MVASTPQFFFLCETNHLDRKAWGRIHWWWPQEVSLKILSERKLLGVPKGSQTTTRRLRVARAATLWTWPGQHQRRETGRRKERIGKCRLLGVTFFRITSNRWLVGWKIRKLVETTRSRLPFDPSTGSGQKSRSHRSHCFFFPLTSISCPLHITTNDSAASWPNDGAAKWRDAQESWVLALYVWLPFTGLLLTQNCYIVSTLKGRTALRLMDMEQWRKSKRNPLSTNSVRIFLRDASHWS